MVHLARYPAIQNQLQQLTQVVKDVLQTPTDFRNVSDAREAQATLEELVMDLDTAYSSAKLVLRSYHNKLSLINKLPDELLLIIFTHAYNPQSRRQMFQYIYLTWVCSRWRSIGLNCAKLWTCVDLECRNPDVIQEWLFRSKLAKLSVTQGRAERDNFNDVGQDIVALEQLVAPQLRRVDSLSLKLHPRRLKDIRHFLQQEAPYLRHFHLSHAVEVVPFVPPYHQPSETSISPLRFPKLFNNTAQLHSLSFDLLSIPSWDDFIPLTRDLRELRVTTMRFDATQKRLALEQLLSILATCPTLETLDFGSVSAWDLMTPSRITVAPVPMPKLWQLTIQGHEEAEILPYINTPRLQHLSLYLDWTVADSLVRSISNRFDLASLKEMIIDTNGKVSETSERGEYTLHCRDSGRKELYVRFRQGDGLNLKFTSALLPFLPNSSCLVLRGDTYGDHSFIRTFKQTRPDTRGVTHLVIAWPSQTLSLLTIFEDPLIFPNITKVTLVFIGWGYRYIHLDEQLLAFARARQGSLLKEIYVVDYPTLRDPFLQAMHELGVRVFAMERDYNRDAW